MIIPILLKIKKKALLTTAAFISIMLLIPSAYAADIPNSNSMLQGSQNQSAAMNAGYGSLASSLVTYYAGQKKESLANFINANSASVSNLYGANTQQLEAALQSLQATSPMISTSAVPQASSSATSAPVGASTQNPANITPNFTTNSMQTATTALNAAALTQGMLLDASKYNSLSAYAAAINSSTSVDSQVIKAGAQWSQQMAALHLPAITSPQAPALSTKLATSMPTSGLAFGLFMNKSITNLVTNSPDIFSQIQKTGLGTTQNTAAWTKAMQQAISGSQSDLTTMLPSKCIGVMLTTTASGTASNPGLNSNGCSGCVAAGMYLHTASGSLLNPAVSSTKGSVTNGLVSPNGWSQLQDWQKNIISSQNSDLNSQLQNSNSSNSISQCTSGSASATNTLNTTLPGVFANLLK